MLWRVSYDVSAEVAALIENYRCGRKIKQTCLDVLSALLLFEQKYKSNKTPGSFLSCFHQLHRYKTLIMCVFINILLLGVTSPRGGGLLEVYPPQTKLQALQIETRNTINQLRFYQCLECQALQHKPKAPPQKCKDPYWKLSGDGSVLGASQVPQTFPKASQRKKFENWLTLCYSFHKQC